MKMFEKKGELNEDAKDVLYELGNVGAGTAASAIGTIRNMQIRLQTPDVFVMGDNMLPKAFEDPEQMVIGICTTMDKAAGGGLLFLLDCDLVKNTINRMLDCDYTIEEILADENALSALYETVNYMTAGYAKAIGAYLNIPVFMKPAAVGQSKVRDLIDKILKDVKMEDDQAVCVNTRFIIADQSGTETDETGEIMIFPQEDCVRKFMEFMEG